MEISKYNASHEQIQGQNHVIISVEAKKSFLTKANIAEEIQMCGLYHKSAKAMLSKTNNAGESSPPTLDYVGEQ